MRRGYPARRRAATLPGAGQDRGVQGGRGSPVKGGPALTPVLGGIIPLMEGGAALLGVKPRCVGAVWIGLPPLCCTRIGTHASLLFAEGRP